MKLHLTTAENNNLITAYGEGYIEINKQRYTKNLIVMPNLLILDWQPATVADVRNHHFEQVVQQNPELVILGTGAEHSFLHPQHYQHLSNHHIALECMNTAAACRTYNILMSEGRNIAVILII